MKFHINEKVRRITDGAVKALKRYAEDQSAKADAGKLKITLVPIQIIRDLPNFDSAKFAECTGIVDKVVEI